MQAPAAAVWTLRSTRRGVLALIAAWAAPKGLARETAATAPPHPGPDAVLLAREHGEDVVVAEHLVSEKLDGVRALWDGHALRYRSGDAIAAPAWFLGRLPRQPLDGELWLGRGRFEALAATVRRARPDDAAWRAVRYMVFELPRAPGTFVQRVSRLQAIVAAARFPALVFVEQQRLPDRVALQRRLDEVVRAGGEGLMLHRADAPYVVGRSDVLRKLKPRHDAEATVVAHLPGQGRHAGRLGALRVRTPDGLLFDLGTGLSDADRDRPPPVGSLVTYQHRGLTRKGVPRFASFLRRREPF